MRTYPLFGFLLGVLLVVIGIISFLLLSSRVTLTCMRPSNLPHQCEIVSAGKLRTQKRELRLTEITGASIEKTTDWLRKRGPRTIYRVVINTKSGAIPLTEGFSSEITDKRRTVDQITAFLRNRAKPTLKIEERDTGLAFVVAMFFAVIGCVLVRQSMRSSLY